LFNSPRYTTHSWNPRRFKCVSSPRQSAGQRRLNLEA
jgi:hypothetical protein